ncbi:[FeFe] hydrogenase, group A [Colidextribacter sp. 210702-DFI.3.9]|nr:[FeFe] hydrogenase, group A [Colidextribacter sp. 210702-DFI.3.9]MCG4470091.1 [FeFe] hydrogenase, group A [Lawsonibacter sp. DFI.6.74]MCG4774505.1 [FeFe] hydrogenase, group A [Lawsonibacter sp. DFI.5.51]
MVTLTINGQTVQVSEETTILEAASQAAIHIPHLCYLKDINEIAACRVCCVEVEGEQAMVTACNTPVREGMVVHTNSPRARATRRTNVELILSQHDCKCATCVRSGNCHLQAVANDLGILTVPYETQLPQGLRKAWTTTFPLFHDYNKCIKCMRCVQVCDKVQSLGIWELTGTGGRATIDVSGNRVIKDSDCALCGQCITHCPVGGLRERDDTQRAFRVLADQDKITVVQVAPAVRTAWGEYFGLKREEATMERMAATLRRLGFDYIFDTNFTADLTIMEEGNEFLQRLKSGDLAKWPMFTSCCPGWVRFLKGQYPELTDRLSTAKSPQQMFGSLAKSWLAQKLGVEPEKIFCVSIMPCVAKKAECELPTMATEHGPDVDLVLTTRELVRMIRADKLDPATLPEEPMDDPMGIHTGAGVIFGATGGVMEAALRTSAFVLTGKDPDPDAFAEVRTGPGLREATYEVAGIPVRCAVVSGLGNARELIERLKAGKAHYDFVEVMACPGGCVGGGGQPVSVEDEELYSVRGQRLYDLDKAAPVRFSHENPQVQALYNEFLGHPLSHKSEELLHTDHSGWNMPNQRKTE